MNTPLKKTLIFCAAVAAMLVGQEPVEVSAATNALNQNLVVNGSFELGIDPGVQIDAPNSNALTGWMVTSGNIDYYGSAWVAGDGARSLDMNGTTAGAISQRVSGFTVGQPYRLLFLMAGNPGLIPPLPAIKRLRATVGTFSQEYSFNANGFSESNLGWTRQTLDFTAATSTLTLTFTSLTDGLGGAALDQVAITGLTNPEPPKVYDVSRDFSKTANPSGAWAFGWVETLSGAFTPLTYEKNFVADNGVPLSAWQVSDGDAPNVSKNVGDATAISAGGAFTGPPGTVWFGPGNDGTPRNFGMIRFSVPPGGAASYRIETSVRPVFDGAISADSDFHVTRNGMELFGQFLPPQHRHRLHKHPQPRGWRHNRFCHRARSRRLAGAYRP